MTIQFDNSYLKLGDSFYRASVPTKFSSPRLILFNEELAKELGLPLSLINNQSELTQIFSGSTLIPNGAYISQVYAGHQFGHFNPILGDGRAILIGEMLDKNGKRFDLQLKGGGPTPYSRRGDGFSALGPVLREYLISEFMHKVGIPTTRALAAVITGDQVFREKGQPGGVFTRVASSHIRIGTFEYFANQGNRADLRKLLDYSIKRHYGELEEKTPLHFLEAVAKRQANLVAKWMAVGFIHGVMNTDNMTVSGETIDFGPCAFMDYFNYLQVYSFIDRGGRYAYGNQPQILSWNLSRLADALLPLIEEDLKIREEEAIQKCNEILSLIPKIFEESFTNEFSYKLSLEKSPTHLKKEITAHYLNHLEKNHLDFTSSFHEISGSLDQQDEASVHAPIMKELRALYLSEGISLSHVQENIKKRNPLFIPRNHLIEEAIQKAYQGDFLLFYKLNAVLSNPFQEKEREDQKYSSSPRPDEIVRNTFCGT